MKLTMILLTAAIMQVSAKGVSQTVSFTGKNAALKEVLSAVKRQTGFFIIYNEVLLDKAKPVSLNLKDHPLKDFLRQVFSDQPLDYSIKNKTIIISNKAAETVRKHIDNVLAVRPGPIRGRVVDSAGNPLAGATVINKKTKNSGVTNAEGVFTINASAGDVLVISFVGYQSTEYKITPAIVASSDQQPTPGTVVSFTLTLKPSVEKLEEVNVTVNTGFQSLPKERATGSFSTVSQQQLNKRVATDIISKLNGVTSGLVFNVDANSGERKLAVRGRSTIYGNDQPLIVVDNFPFEGDINTINPLDVDNITLLKDAASASIWGARASNGVLVITTRKGRANQPLKAEVTANVTVGQKPDLFYNPNFLNSSDYIDNEELFFNAGAYDSYINAANPANTNLTYYRLSPVVNLLAQKRAGAITEEAANAQLNIWRAIDRREEFSDVFYQPSVNQQYALNLSGGSNKSTYYFSSGFDKNLSNLKENGFKRISIRAWNTFTPIKQLELTGGIYYTQANTQTDRTFSETSFDAYPYLQMADKDGTPLPIAKGYNATLTDVAQNRGFLNWHYYPLKELGLSDIQSTNNNIRLNAGVKYTILKGLNIDIKYQYEKSQTIGTALYDSSSYMVRDLVNRYATITGGNVTAFPIPKGAIYDNSTNTSIAQNGRGQINYNTSWQEHALFFLAGLEVWEKKTMNNSSRLYGYDPAVGTYQNVNYGQYFSPLFPTGADYIPNNVSIYGSLDRYRSYFSNAAYTYKGKYTVSGSARIDQSNYFGVTANQRSVPLWSAGAKYNLSQEPFYHLKWLPLLNARTSYGFNGNLDKSVTALTTAINRTNAASTGAPYEQISNAPNSNLRWERTRIWNIGVDFALKNHILSGSIEYFTKKGLDMLADKILPPSSGFISPATGDIAVRQNFGQMSGQGFDLDLQSLVINKTLTWSIRVLFSRATDKVTRLDITNPLSTIISAADGNRSSGATGIYPYVGYPVYAIYSYKWAGLDPANGDPRGYLKDAVSSNYDQLVNPVDFPSINYHGSARPRTYGGITNTISYKGVSVFFNIGYKLDYYFRRQTIIYTSFGSVLGVASGHKDFSKRWMKTGDELHTTVPSQTMATNGNRDAFYAFSEINVERGDHVRLQDINISYDVNSSKGSPFKMLRFYVYANNLGILWRANKQHLDPDVIRSNFPTPRTIAVGLTAQF